MRLCRQLVRLRARSGILIEVRHVDGGWIERGIGQDIPSTLQGLIVLYAAVTFPFVVWLMRSFFQEVPREVSEAAIVDGCTQWGAFFKAVLPQVKGGLAATALFVFILNWSDFLIALVMLVCLHVIINRIYSWSMRRKHSYA